MEFFSQDAIRKGYVDFVNWLGGLEELKRLKNLTPEERAEEISKVQEAADKLREEKKEKKFGDEEYYLAVKLSLLQSGCNYEIPTEEEWEKDRRLASEG